MKVQAGDAGGVILAFAGAVLLLAAVNGTLGKVWAALKGDKAPAPGPAAPGPTGTPLPVPGVPNAALVVPPSDALARALWAAQNPGVPLPPTDPNLNMQNSPPAPLPAGVPGSGVTG